MFNENFNPETSLKKWATVLRGLSICLISIAFLVAIALFGSAVKLWWISLIILAGAGLIMLMTYLSTAILWAFGDMVGNTKRMSCGSTTPKKKNDDVLPDL